MSKNSSDASRFTQTTPNAARPTITRSTTINKVDPKPVRPPTTSSGAGIETPAQKVARLRAAHLAKRAAEISTWDRVVVRGREVADKAHRWTVMGIVVASVVIIGVTGFTIGDMVRYNRKKKREFYEQRSELFKVRLVEALEAEGKGVATEDQQSLLQEERERSAAAEAKKQKLGAWQNVKAYVSRALDMNLNKEDRQYGERRREILDRLDEQEKKVAAGTATHTVSATLQTIQDKRQESERQSETRNAQPGPLDRFADGIANRAQAEAKSLTNWFSRK